jgi:hypothetical protein
MLLTMRDFTLGFPPTAVALADGAVAALFPVSAVEDAMAGVVLAGGAVAAVDESADES